MSGDSIFISSDELNVQVSNDGDIIVTQIGTPGERGAPGVEGPAGPMIFQWEGEYSGSTTYQPYEVGVQPGSVVTYGGETYFLYAAATAGTVPTNTAYWAKIAAKGAQGIAGPGNLTYEGEWSSGTSYSANDAVSYAGSLYAAKTSISSGGSAPDVNSDWQLVVQKGDSPDATPPWITSVDDWEIGTWAARQGVRHEGRFYRCVSGHTSTSGSRQEPGTAGGASRWQLIADRGAPGDPGADSVVPGPPGKNAVTWWALHFPGVSGTRRMIVPTACNVRLDQAIAYGTGTYTVYKNGTEADGQTVCARGDRLAVVASTVSGDYTVSFPIQGT